MDMPIAINKAIAGQDFSREEMSEIMQLIMTGKSTDAQTGGFLIALRMKGESVNEIIGAAEVMRSLATVVEVSKDNLVDTCGTGGSGSEKFNVSTASAIVAAAAGARVAKHGNRSASSKVGSADLLEKAGVNLDMTPAQVARSIESVGVGFLFAVNYHTAMKYAIGPRKEMAVRTIFNLLGPLTNPAGAPNQVLGVFDRKWVRPLAEVLKILGSKHVLVVHSDDDLDEISISATTHMAELKDGEITEHIVSPEGFGLRRASLSDLVVKTPEESLNLTNKALKGDGGAATDIVALNAGAAIYAANCCDTLSQGVDMALDAIATGLATEKLKQLIAFSEHIDIE
jgi:anthranilate phosphoribosyltransferase